MTIKPRILILLLAVLIGASVVAGCDVAKDARLQTKIHEELSKHKDIAYDKLTINVAKGVVTISGELNTKDQIEQVVQIVTAIPGVVKLDNKMKLPDNYNSSNPTFLDPF